MDAALLSFGVTERLCRVKLDLIGAEVYTSKLEHGCYKAKTLCSNGRSCACSSAMDGCSRNNLSISKLRCSKEALIKELLETRSYFFWQGAIFI